MGKSWCGSSQKEIEERKRSEQLCECKMNKYIEINGIIETCYKCGKARK